MVPDNCDGKTGRLPLRIGEWLFEPDLDRVSRGDECRSLRPRVTELLLCLVERAGELAAKRDLVDGVWQTEFVTDNALTHLIAELRTALGDDAENPRFVETIPRRGYRLIAPVTPLKASPTAETAEAARFVLVDEDGVELGLHEGENLIGRAPDATIRVDVSEVSRKHARILVQDTNVTLEDLGSKNGTFLRGRRLELAARLADADEIQIGLNLARFRFKVIDDRTKTEQLTD